MDAHQRVIIDDGAAGGGNASLGAAGNPLWTASPTYPATRTPAAQTNSAANAALSATLAAVAGKTTYIAGFQITGGGATAAAVVDALLTGIFGGVALYAFGVVAGAGLACPSLIVKFDPPLPASAPNTAITLSLAALGAGNVVAGIAIQGYQE